MAEKLTNKKPTQQAILNSLQALYKIGYKKGKDSNLMNKIYPIQSPKIDDSGNLKFTKEQWPVQVQQVWELWANNSWKNEEEWKNRNELYDDMDMMYHNSSIISSSINLIADEVIQADSNMQCIGVEAKRKIKKDILDFFDNIGIYEKIRPLVMDIVQYGNGYLIPSLEKEGVDAVIPVEVRDVKERIEFTPHEVKEKLKNNDRFLTKYKNKADRINFLIKSIENKENYASYYKSYLFGFQVGDFVLPPWRFIHFRNKINRSPFKPFGIPVYIHAVAPYSQYDLAMSLQVAARGAQFPIEVYKITIPNTVSPTEKMAKTQQLISRLHNQGFGRTKKEEVGVGEMIVTINDLYDFDLKESNIDLGRIDDVEMLRDDLIVASRIPRNLIDPNDSSFGDSGVSLIQKWKPFARLVFSIQSIVLEGLTQLVKIHLIQTGKYKLSDIDFVLTMPYPESQINDEMISNQSDLIDLAGSIMDSLSDKYMDGEALPSEIIKDIYSQFLPYDDKRIDSWFKILDKSKNGGDDEDSKVKEEDNILIEKWNKMKIKLGPSLFHESIKEVIFEKRQENFREGKNLGKHYYSSRNNTDDSFDISMLAEYRNDRIKRKLNENILEKEELKYEYEFISKKTKKKKKSK